MALAVRLLLLTVSLRLSRSAAAPTFEALGSEVRE